MKVMTMKAKKYKSILGLAFEGRSLSICLMQRPGGRLRIDKSLKVPLTLDPLSGEPELVGREIRNHLDGAGIRERNCAVCLPLKWILTLQTEIPSNLTGEDLDNFISLQAERSFPYQPEDLFMGVAYMRPVEGACEATVVAVTKSSLANLEAVFKAANLRPVIFTIAPASLGLATTSAALIAGEGSLDLAIFGGGGFAAIRPLDDALDSGPDGTEWDVDLIAQQMRITLGRMPQALRGGIKTLLVYGAKDDVASLVGGLRPVLTPMGLAVQGAQPEIAGQKIDPAQWSPAATVAASILLGKPPVCNLLPPHIGRFKQLAGRISARGAIFLGGGAIVLALTVGGLFFYQGYMLDQLTKQEAQERPNRSLLALYKENRKTFNNWFDPAAKTLTILRKMADVFPAQGTVWVKTLEIKDISVEKKATTVVTCTGNAQTNGEWLTLDTNLSAIPEVDSLEVQNVKVVRNQPVQFSFTFHWEGDKLQNAITKPDAKKAGVAKKTNDVKKTNDTKKANEASNAEVNKGATNAG